MNTEILKTRLREVGLKATPRRMLIIQAISDLANHPTAEEIIKFVRNHGIDISTATVYKALDILVERKVLVKVETGNQAIRYDSVIEPHHHLYNPESDIIKDYQSVELNKLLDRFFKKNKIKDFDIDEVKLQIFGKFKLKNK